MGNKVVNIIDNRTFDIDGYVFWKGKFYSRIRIRDWDSPCEGECGYDESLDKFQKALDGNLVEVKGCIKEDGECLECLVYKDGKDLRECMLDGETDMNDTLIQNRDNT